MCGVEGQQGKVGAGLRVGDGDEEEQAAGLLGVGIVDAARRGHGSHGQTQAADFRSGGVGEGDPFVHEGVHAPFAMFDGVQEGVQVRDDAVLQQGLGQGGDDLLLGMVRRKSANNVVLRQQETEIGCG